jgi:hypothetical protein
MSIAQNIKDFANAFSACAEEIEGLTNSPGESYYMEKNTKHWDYLQTHGFIYHCGESHYKGTPTLYELVANISMRTTMRRVAPDVNDWYETLDTDIEHMMDADSRGDENSRKQHLQRIDYHVALMTNCLEKEVLDLEYNISSKLGKMESLKAKVKENVRLISRAQLFVTKLASLKMDRLIPFADKDSDLRNILMIGMSPRIANYSDRFSTALPRLKKMLYQAKIKTKETQRIWALNRHFESNKQCLADDFSDEFLQNSIFNIAQPLSIGASIDTNNLESDELILIAENLKAQVKDNSSQNDIPVERVKYVENNNNVIDVKQPVLYPYFIDFIKSLSDKPTSAMEFWRTQDATQSGRSWLMWLSLEVIKHEALSSDLCLLPEDKISGNITVYDIKVSVNAN